MIHVTEASICWMNDNEEEKELVGLRDGIEVGSTLAAFTELSGGFSWESWGWLHVEAESSVEPKEAKGTPMK